MRLPDHVLHDVEFFDIYILNDLPCSLLQRSVLNDSILDIGGKSSTFLLLVFLFFFFLSFSLSEKYLHRSLARFSGKLLLIAADISYARIVFATSSLWQLKIQRKGDFSWNPLHIGRVLSNSCSIFHVY